MGNMELRELRQTSSTIQCPSCLKHVPEGLNKCLCDVCLRPNQSTMDRSRAAFAALKIPYYRTTVILSNGRKSGHNQWQMDHQKAIDARRGATKRRIHLETGPMAERRNIPRFSIGARLLRRGSSTSPTSPRLTSIMQHLTDSDYDMKARSTWEALIPINKQDHCVNDKIVNHQQMLLSAFNELRAKVYLIFRCTWGRDKLTRWIPQSNNT